MQLAEFMHFYAPFCYVFFALLVPDHWSDAKSLREFRPNLNVRQNRFFSKLSVVMVVSITGLVILISRAEDVQASIRCDRLIARRTLPSPTFHSSCKGEVP